MTDQEAREGYDYQGRVISWQGGTEIPWRITWISPDGFVAEGVSARTREEAEAWVDYQDLRIAADEHTSRA